MDESASLLRVVPTVIGLIFPLVPFKRGVTFRILRSVIVPLVAPPPSVKTIKKLVKTRKPLGMPEELLKVLVSPSVSISS